MRGSRTFCQRGSNVKFFFCFLLCFCLFVFELMWGGWIQIPPQASHHRPARETPLNGVSLACWWWPNNECWLGSFMIFREPWTVLLRNTIFLWFSGGSGPPAPPPLDPRKLELCHVCYLAKIMAINMWYLPNEALPWDVWSITSGLNVDFTSVKDMQ